MRDVEGSIPVAIGASSVEKASLFAKKHNLPHFYSYEDLCKSPEVDIVYVATIHNLHKDQTLFALNHGKHVLCEKPMGINEKEVQAMIDLAREKKLFLMEAFWTRFFPISATLRQLLAEQKLGEIKSVGVAFGFRNPPENDIQRISDPNLAGGGLLDIGCYAISCASSIAGGHFPSKILAVGKVNNGIDENVGILLEYPHFIANLRCCVTAEMTKEADIIGSLGKVRIPNFWCPTQMQYEPLQGEPVLYSVPIPHKNSAAKDYHYMNSNGFQYEIEHVQQTIAAGKIESDILSLNESLVIIRVMDVVRSQIGLKYPWEK